MALQDGWFSDTFVKALGNSIALDLDDTTAGAYKGALFTSSVASGTIDFDATNPAYGSSPFATNESSGPGYTAGGANITVATWAVISGTANKVGWDISDLAWTATTITAAGLLIYVPGLSNRALLYRYFGQEYPTNDGDLSITWPADGATRFKLRTTA